MCSFIPVECCPRVKLNNKNAAYLDLILLIFIELVFFFFSKIRFGQCAPEGNDNSERWF